LKNFIHHLKLFFVLSEHVVDVMLIEILKEFTLLLSKFLGHKLLTLASKTLHVV
jgi:hypothetical protein